MLASLRFGEPNQSMANPEKRETNVPSLRKVTKYSKYIGSMGTITGIDGGITSRRYGGDLSDGVFIIYLMNAVQSSRYDVCPKIAT